MTLTRRVEPEWLDSLPDDDLRAIDSRRDLRRLNWLMLHATILTRILSSEPIFARRYSILDIGGGDGTFMLSIARKLARKIPGAVVTTVDRQTSVSSETCRNFSALGWNIVPLKADVLEFLDNANPASTDVVTANLFLHHFSDSTIARLFGRAADVAPLFVACEPRRAMLPMLASRLLWAIGCNKVTQHDAPASVRAGFRGNELSTLWPKSSQWKLQESRSGLFSHCFIARHVS